MGQSRGNQAQASRNPSQWSHRGHHSLARSCDVYEMLPTREVHWRLRTQSFSRGLVGRQPLPGTYQVLDSQKESKCSV